MADFNDLKNAPGDLNSIGDASHYASDGLGSMALKAEGALSVLQDIGGVLNQIAKNPLASAYALNTIGNKIRDHINKELKDVNRYTLEEVAILKKVSEQLPGILRVSAAIASIGLNAAESYRQILRMSTEIGRFTNMTKLPGGADNRFGAAQTMLGREAGTTFELNADIARIATQQYEAVRSYFGKGKRNDELSYNLAKQFAVYMNNTRGELNLGNIFGKISRSMPQAGPAFLGKQLTEMAGLTQFTDIFGPGNPTEHIDAMLRGITAIQEGTGVGAPEAFKQGISAYALLKSLTVGKDINGEPIQLGSEIVTNLISGLARASREPGGRLVQQQFGISTTEALNPNNPRALANLLASMKREVGGATSFSQLGAEKQMRLRAISGAMGLTEEQYMTISKIDDAYKNIDNTASTLLNFQKNIETHTKTIDNDFKKLHDEMSKTKGLGDYFQGIMQSISKFSNSIAEWSGLSPSIIQAASLGVMGYGLGKGAGKILPILWNKGKSMLTGGGTIGADAIIGGSAQTAEVSKILDQFERPYLKSATVSSTTAEMGTLGKMGGFLKRPGVRIGAGVAGAISLYDILSGRSSNIPSDLIETGTIAAATKVGMNVMTKIGAGSLGALPAFLFSPSELGEKGYTKNERLNAELKLIQKGLKDNPNAFPEEYLKRFSEEYKQQLIKEGKSTEGIFNSGGGLTATDSNTQLGTVRIMVVNNKDEILGQGSVGLNPSKPEESALIRVFLGGALSSGIS